jgi:hypothetical protein
MNGRFLAASTLAVALAAPAAISGEEHDPTKHRAVEQTPEWQKLTSLAGEWTGTMVLGEQAVDATVEVRLTGGDSALMHVLGKGSEHEMVTMFHADHKRLLATHYCGAHNQPRMALVPSKAPNTLAFEFVDGTNIGPGDGYMGKLLITFIDPDHHDETWTYIAAGKEVSSTVFHFARKSAGSAPPTR